MNRFPRATKKTNKIERSEANIFHIEFPNILSSISVNRIYQTVILLKASDRGAMDSGERECCGRRGVATTKRRF